MPEHLDFLNPSIANHDLIKPALRQLFALAEKYYQSGYAGLSYLPLRNRFCVLLAAKLYQEIGIKAQRNDFNVWDRRIVVTNARKLLIIGSCVVLFIKNFLIPKKSPIHDESLHRPLTPWLNS
jgi:phytoene synthase